MKARPSHLRIPVYLPAVLVALSLFTSCAVVPKNYPKNKPFVFDYGISVQGNISKEEKGQMESQLENQLDDSIHVRTVPKFFHSNLNNPPVFDSANADKSVQFMQTLMRSLGYYYSTITYDYTIKKVGEDQLRTTVNFTVDPGKLVRLDTVTYNLTNAELEKLAIENKKDAIVKKGDAFSKGPMTEERNRLVELYRNNGYLRFSANEIIGLWDTLDLAILQPSFDPFEQIEILERLKTRQENPTANLDYRLRPGFDSARIVKYYNGNLIMYPELSLDTTSTPYRRLSLDSGRFVIVYQRGIFKPKFLRRNYYLKYGDLYRQSDLIRTIDRYNLLGAWKLVNIEPLPRPKTDTVDFKAQMVPADKYSFSVTLEGNKNTSSITGDLWGTGVNLSIQNRNFARTANLSVTNIRYGIEFGTNGEGIQTQQVTVTQNLYFPRLLIPSFVHLNQKYRDHSRTVFSFGGGITDRFNFYNLKTITGSWGYEYSWNNKFIAIRIPNFEYSDLIEREKLTALFKNNAILKNLFTDGLIISSVVNYNMNWSKKTNRVNFLRVNFEESGIITGVIRNKFFDTNLYRFVKIDAEISRKITLKKWNDGTDKTVLAMRMMSGIGYELGSTIHPAKRNNLPFFKAFYAGGPNSMRAWRLRTLGQGSLVKDFNDTTGAPERYGDMQLEANIEYRFHLFKYAGAKFNGAFFTDIGNIWYVKKAAAAPTEQAAVFNINRLGKDIAVGMGMGLRIDLSFVVIRFDYAYKVKDPSPDITKADRQNKWFYNIKPLNGTLQIGISYPFVL